MNEEEWRESTFHEGVIIIIIIIIIKDNVYGAVIVTYNHCESSPGSSDECRSVLGDLRLR